MRCLLSSLLFSIFLLPLFFLVPAEAGATWEDLLYLHSQGLNYYNYENKTPLNTLVVTAPSNTTPHFLYSITYVNQGLGGFLDSNTTHWFVDRGPERNDYITVYLNLLVKGSRPTRVGLSIKSMNPSTTQRYVEFKNAVTDTAVCTFSLPNDGISQPTSYVCSVPAGVQQIVVWFYYVSGGTKQPAYFSALTFNIVSDEMIVVRNPDILYYLFVMGDGRLQATSSQYFSASPRAYSTLYLLTSTPTARSAVNLCAADFTAVNGTQLFTRRVCPSETEMTEVYLNDTITLGNDPSVAAFLVERALQNKLFIVLGNDSNRFISMLCSLVNHTYVGVREYDFEKAVIVVQLDESGNEVWARPYLPGHASIPVTSRTRYIAIYDYETNTLNLFVTLQPSQTVTAPPFGWFLRVNGSLFTPLLEVPNVLAVIARDYPATFALIPALIVAVGGRKYASAFIALAGVIVYVLAVSLLSESVRSVVINAGLLFSIAFLAAVVEEVRRR